MSELTLPVSKRDHIQGSLDAPVIMVEYGDYECVRSNMRAGCDRIAKAAC